MFTYFLVIMITLVLMSIYILGVLRESLYNDRLVQLFAKANIISDTIAPYFENPEGADGSAMAEQILAGSGVRGVDVNASCTVVYDTNTKTPLVG